MNKVLVILFIIICLSSLISLHFSKSKRGLYLEKPNYKVITESTCRIIIAVSGIFIFGYLTVNTSSNWKLNLILFVILMLILISQIYFLVNIYKHYKNKASGKNTENSTNKDNSKSEDKSKRKYATMNYEFIEEIIKHFSIEQFIKEIIPYVDTVLCMTFLITQMLFLGFYSVYVMFFKNINKVLGLFKAKELTSLSGNIWTILLFINIYLLIFSISKLVCHIINNRSTSKASDSEEVREIMKMLQENSEN
ncbi:hypothetical protein DW257_04265 [Catenibacterium sp. AM22-15]|uniref:hypothetical protein n=1 Tax=unclassified Catenibacterium TaxID=2643636 RepID=UPI000E3EFD7F|nr:MULTISPECIES: hypothetical protein [unclassified Catenibacterium]RGE98292.1 hypothetical protein DW269_05025 [Catenibacterium sp. AM22-6LB]RGF07536.1 hypothetical protein DW257_04265 [Catenibacterium sp. AM22-15]